MKQILLVASCEEKILFIGCNVMSLILVTRFEQGILFAGDPFVFDNDGEIPQKRLNFNKFYYSSRFRFALVAVGSRWVFSSLLGWIESIETTQALSLKEISLKWLNLNLEWKEMRRLELSEHGEKTLRDISDSLFIFASASDLETIWIVNSRGQISSSKTFAFSGSGTYLVQLYLEKSGKSFQPSSTFDETLALAKECYAAAGSDLYVFGLPSIAVLTPNLFIDLSDNCQKLWAKCQDDYFVELRKYF